jgi:hypothetical protein
LFPKKAMRHVLCGAWLFQSAAAPIMGKAFPINGQSAICAGA